MNEFFYSEERKTIESNGNVMISKENEFALFSVLMCLSISLVFSYQTL